jgi:hypothetical protein
MEVPKYLEAKHSVSLVDPEGVRAIYQASNGKVRAVVVHDNENNSFSLSRNWRIWWIHDMLFEQVKRAVPSFHRFPWRLAF